MTTANISAQDFTKHQWKHRILIVQSNQTSSSLIDTQLEEFVRDPSGLKERRLVLYQVVKDQYKKINYQEEQEDGVWLPLRKDTEKWRNKNTPFSVTLIGLDGGVKLESTEILQRKELYRTIDSMPMRRAEIKNKGN